MRNRLPILGVAALTFFTTTLSAQALDTLAVGTRVRVTSLADNLRREQGTIVGTAGDTLIFRPKGCDTACPILRLAPDALDRLEVFNGRSTARGFLVGGLAGSAVGLLIGFATDHPSSCNGRQSDLAAAGECVGRAVVHPILTGGIGFLAGALIGGGIGIGDTWRDLKAGPPEVRLGFAPTRSGIALTLRASF